MDVLQQELSRAEKKLEKKDSELEKKYLELQVATKGLKAANQLAKDIKVELNRERIIFQGVKNGLLREVEWALVDKTEVENQTDEDVERLQREVNVFKLMKYRDGFNEGVQGKALSTLSRSGVSAPTKA